MAAIYTLILNPFSAFIINLGVCTLLHGLGRLLAGPGQTTPLKISTYSSGELPPTHPAAPGYRPFFVIALFFAVLHLGALVLASGTFSLSTAIYLSGLGLALVVLILG